MKGRVAVMTQYRADFEIRDYPVPEVEPDAALVKITRGGICGSDLHIWRGELEAAIGKPDRGQTFGHEMCGVVERLGKNVRTDSTGQPLAEGDRVTYCYFYPCGRCPACLDGAESSTGRMSSSGLTAVWTTLLATLPSSQRRTPETPWVAIAIRQPGSFFAQSTITAAGSPRSTVPATSFGVVKYFSATSLR